MIIGLVISVGVAAFFGGMFFANMDSETITKSELDQAISRIENKIDKLQAVNTPEEFVRFL